MKPISMMHRFLSVVAGLLCVASASAWADPPSVHYVFPAGAQRGTTVPVRIGGCYLYERAPLVWLGEGLKASPEMVQTERIWFEGPVIKQPASQQKEDYPFDYAATLSPPANAPLGVHLWRTWNAQGAVPVMPFVIGDLPEIVEQEYDGEALPQPVTLPVTANGRIFPREDLDIWAVDLSAGQTVTCQVVSSEIGSPLEAQLEVRDPTGRLLAEAAGKFGRDPVLRFTAPAAGRYEVRIWDSAFRGLQHFVYRLTLTSGPFVDRVYPLGGQRGSEMALSAAGQALAANGWRYQVPERTPGAELVYFATSPNGMLFDVDDFPEVLEPASGLAPSLTAPVVANGRISSPGQIDAWNFAAFKGQPLAVEVRAARLGSPLDAALVIKDASGKELAKADDLPGGSPDCELSFNPPADGVYTAEIRERFRSRGGPDFAYRLKIAPPAPDFQLTLATDTLAAPIGVETKLSVNIQRVGGMKSPIKLTVAGLPQGVSVKEVTAAPNQAKADLLFQVSAETPVSLAEVEIVGVAEEGGVSLSRKAIFTPAYFGSPQLEKLALVCSLVTPFKFRGQYEFKYVPRGAGLKKTFTIERNGYTGPLEARLADRQGRHLQGVSGPTVKIPANADEFEYAVNLPPWMELGRTSRSNLMLIGELTDSAGKKHKVSFSTNDQNDQLIALVSPAPLRLSAENPVLPVTLGAPVAARVLVHRDRSLAAAVKLEWVIPAHIQGVTAESLELPADQATAVMRLQIGPNAGPFNAPLVLRATSRRGVETVTAELPLELIPQPTP
jgi:hypothetical protein